LRPKQKAIYRQSDALGEIVVEVTESLAESVGSLRRALSREERKSTARACEHLAAELVGQWGASPVRLQVLAVRPASDWGELHGLYTLEPATERATIQLWMRTAKQRRVVAFRTFLRTLLHELCHHHDFTVLRLAESYHTHGFFRREASLLRQLVGADSRLGELALQGELSLD
jgi:hypothetical protein